MLLLIIKIIVNGYFFNFYFSLKFSSSPSFIILPLSSIKAPKHTKAIQTSLKQTLSLASLLVSLPSEPENGQVRNRALATRPVSRRHVQATGDPARAHGVSLAVLERLCSRSLQGSLSSSAPPSQGP